LEQKKKKKYKPNEEKNESSKKKKKSVPLVTLHMCHVTNGGSIGNVAHMQRY
jgi:hypothetical protein